MRFDPTACVLKDGQVVQSGEVGLRPEAIAVTAGDRRRKYHQTKRTLGPRNYRTRVDSFEVVEAELRERFLQAPGITAKLLLEELQRRYPGEYPDGLLRTLQRRVKEWRRRIVVEFDDRLVTEDLLVGESLPLPLRAVSLTPTG